MLEDSDYNGGVNRRNLLRTVGATGAAVAGATGVTGATSSERPDAVGIPGTHLEDLDDEQVRAYRKYANDETMRRQAFDEHVDSVATLLESVDVSAPSSLDEAESVDVAPERKDGQASAHVVARFEGDEEILFHVFPQAGRAYAYVMRGQESLLVDPAQGVEPTGCTYSYNCDCPSSCGWYMGYEKKYSVCRLPDGTTSKEYVGGHCGCDDAPNPCHDQ